LQDRINDYCAMSVPKYGSWIQLRAWTVALDGILRSRDGRVLLPVTDLLLF
jgi:hypothetical protein